MKVIDSGVAQAATHMDKDAQLLESLGEDPIVHFYQWQPRALTYGYFIKPEEYFRKEALASFDLAKRPTGGGIIFHGDELGASWTFSLLVPASHPLYKLEAKQSYLVIHQLLAEVAQRCSSKKLELSFASPKAQSATPCCLAEATIYDLLLEGKKWVGCAQRRKKQGFLHQCAVIESVASRAQLSELFLEGSPLPREIQETSRGFFVEGFKEELIKSLGELFNEDV